MKKDFILNEKNSRSMLSESLCKLIIYETDSFCMLEYFTEAKNEDMIYVKMINDKFIINFHRLWYLNNCISILVNHFHLNLSTCNILHNFLENNVIIGYR